MNRRYNSLVLVAVILTTAALMLAACGAPAAQPAAQAPAAPAGPVVNSIGVELPADASPLDQQVMRYPYNEATWMTWDASVYDENEGDVFAWADSCLRPDKNYEPQPNLCTEWSLSDDKLTWTFKMDPNRVWSDGEPITADDMVFTFQRYARPDYDFEWFYGMANIENWGKVVSGEVAPEELGVKKVDDYTFTIKTAVPTPYLYKLMADAWVVPQHVVKDRLNDGSWAFDPNNQVFGGPFKLESYEKGKQMVFVPNEKYTGPFKPMIEKLAVVFIEPEVRFAAYQNNELDYVGGSFTADLPPSAMAQIMADPNLQKELITWPNFQTNYLFFDTWNPPFDNLKVRQAFSHAIDRDKLINGPLQYQGTAAFSMNPPGFPGESVDKLKDVQAFDPELAKQLMAEAGYPDGQGFPKLTMYTRQAFPALTNAAEAIAGMLKENLGVDVQIQDVDWTTFSENMRAQKRNKDGDFIFALVPYEFDFVDGSNLLGVWGGCEDEGADLSDMPGRHTWYSKEYNDLLCEAGSVFEDEAKRNELYGQAERILIEDVALVPIYHQIFVAMVKPYIQGAMFEASDAGLTTWNRFRFSSRESQIYHSTSNRE